MRARTANIISLVVEGDTDRIGSVRGKLGRLPGIRVKSLLFSQMLKNIKSLLKYFSDTTKMVIFGSTIGK